MKPTLEQLNELSDDKLNYAVVEKKGLFAHRGNGELTYKDGKSVLKPFDYCSDPRHYMQIAIEHGIDIKFSHYNSFIKCKFNGIFTEWFTTAQTGRAVCIAFLLMEIDK